MRVARFLSFALAAISICSLADRQAHGATFTQSGSFASDNSSFIYNFTTTSTQNYTFYTTSYGGGPNLNGTTTLAGGFVPILTLFNSAGKVVNFDGADGTCNGPSRVDASTRMCDDAYFAQTLNAGTYSLYLTEFPNGAIGNLSDGFLFSSDPNATGNLCGAPNGKFLQADTGACVQRSANYTLDVNSASPVPEPATWALMVPAIAGLFFLDQRRRQQA